MIEFVDQKNTRKNLEELEEKIEESQRNLDEQTSSVKFVFKFSSPKSKNWAISGIIFNQNSRIDV